MVVFGMIDQLDQFTIIRCNTPLKTVLNYHPWPGLQMVDNGRAFLIHREGELPERYSIINGSMAIDARWQTVDSYDVFCRLHDRPRNDPDPEMKEAFCAMTEGAYKPDLDALKPETTPDGEIIVKV